VVCAAAERAVKSDLNQQGFLFESSIVTVNHFDYTANGGGFRFRIGNHDVECTARGTSRQQTKIVQSTSS